MLQMYTVFVNDKVIYFTNNIEKYDQRSNVLTLTYFSQKITAYLVDLLFDVDEVQSIFIVVNDCKAAFFEFQKLFKIIEAAGGIVKNNEGKQLFIFRLGKWDLPKGKIEEGESVENAAIREIEEECGINQLTIDKPLVETFHLYKYKGEIVFKRTFWFAMSSNYKGILIPQLEENITAVEWLTSQQIKDRVIENTYASIKELLESSN
jgi:8-oxo-dGTP pyrophosphatase MutT (NUDIX family)